ncbi:hypothetical protein [Thermococcus prieurii]
MLRERLRNWLGITETERKIVELSEQVSSIGETLKTQLIELQNLVGDLKSSKAERDVVKELEFRLMELEKEIRMLEKLSLPKMKVIGVSEEEQIKAKIIEILSARETITVSELQSLVGCGWKKFYDALKELEKEKKIVKKREGRRVVLSLSHSDVSLNTESV